MSLFDLGPTTPGSKLVSIIDEAINQVSSISGRIGALQSNVIDTNIATLNSRSAERVPGEERHQRYELRGGNREPDSCPDPLAVRYLGSVDREPDAVAGPQAPRIINSSMNATGDLRDLP